MSKKKNYNKMYDSEKEHIVTEETVEPIVEEESVAEVIEQPVIEAEPEAVTGIVVNCTKLNVREHPTKDAKVMCVLPASAEVTVFMDEKFADWYSICTDDQVLGFCMKQYIKI